MYASGTKREHSGIYCVNKLELSANLSVFVDNLLSLRQNHEEILANITEVQK